MDDENNSEVGYEIQDGLFKKISAKARKNPDQQYALLLTRLIEVMSLTSLVNSLH